MDPIGRDLNPEEQSVLAVLRQEGRAAADRTSVAIATTLERQPPDVAGVLSQLERDGLVSASEDESASGTVYAAAAS